MDEFLKLNWRAKDASDLEPQNCFITEDTISNSVVYKYLRTKAFFKNETKKKVRKGINCNKNIYDHNVYFNTRIKSVLDREQQEHCVKAVKLLQSGRVSALFTKSEQLSINIYNELKAKIIEENSKYQRFALNRWNRDKKRLLEMEAQVFLYGKQTWKKKCERIFEYPKFYKEFSVFNMIYNENEDEGTIDFKCTHNALELGTLAKFTHPNLKTNCKLKCVTLPFFDKNTASSSKCPVSRDRNIDKLLKDYNIDVVLSRSGLKCLTDNSDLRNEWIIPVIVKEVDAKQANGNIDKKKIVYLDKPFPQKVVSKIDLAEISLKRLIKTNFCQYEAFNYEQVDIPVRTEETAEDNLEIENVQNGKAVGGEHHKLNLYHNKIHHNANYRIWNIKKTNCQNNLMKNRSSTNEINVLIRSKLDACESTEKGMLQPVILTPKVERQLRFGANIATKSELAREWTSLFFAPFSNLYRVRLRSATNDVISVEKCGIQKVISEAQVHYDYKPFLGLGTLQKVFEELVKLEPGNYLLQHLQKHEAFVAILQECDESHFNLHEEYNTTTVDDLPNCWVPIDVNFLLPSFEAHGRMPGMFAPREKPIKVFRNKNKSGKPIKVFRKKKKQKKKTNK